MGVAEVSLAWQPKHDLNKDVMNIHANVDGGVSRGPSPRQRTTGKWQMLRVGEIVSLGKVSSKTN